MPLVEVAHLSVHFPVRHGLFSRTRQYVKAVNEVNFSIEKGETLGLVGESGCGKTTLGRTIVGLIQPTNGGVKLDGVDPGQLKRKALREKRREFQIIFQDPYSSLNPRMTVEEIVGEGLAIHRITRTRKELRQRVSDLLSRVGLNPAHMERSPEAFSGGQRQRLGIARALAVEPKLIVCDEPVSALDVSVQAQIINLLEDLQESSGLAYLFIAHDLAVVEHISDRIMVMYLGQIVEHAEAREIVQNPCHPYTQALISAVPVIDQTTKRKRIVLAGDVPSPIDLPKGCPFHTRCPAAEFPQCKTEVPPLREVSPGHWAACHFA